MTPTTPPAVSEAMREAVEASMRKHIRVDASGLIAGIASYYLDGFKAAAEEVLSGPLASEIARLTGERDAAREDHVRAEAHICALEVLAYIDPEHTWKDAAIKERVAKIAAEAETARLRAENALLAANQCEGPMTADEFGHFTCPALAKARAEGRRQGLEEAGDWKRVAERAGVCMTCALGAPDISIGCTDCLNAGFAHGAPQGYVNEGFHAEEVSKLQRRLENRQDTINVLEEIIAKIEQPCARKKSDGSWDFAGSCSQCGAADEHVCGRGARGYMAKSVTSLANPPETQKPETGESR